MKPDNLMNLSGTDVNESPNLLSGKSPLSDWCVFLLVGGMVLAFRLPFLSPGYGNEPDAWRVANAARYIASTGSYVASRLPGYPVHEIASSMLWEGGPVFLNGATALFSGIAVSFFALMLRTLGVSEYVLASFALAFTPIVYISSTIAKDYLWALAFILGSFYFVLVQRPHIAAILLGAAIGSRITSGAMLIPLCFLMHWRQKPRVNLRNMISFAIVACATGAVAFVPVIMRYGFGFFTFYEKYSPTLREIFFTMTLGVWGTVGVLGLSVAFLSLVCSFPHLNYSHYLPSSTRIIVRNTALVAIGIYVLSFLRLPHQSGYLIPIVPFTILLLATTLERKVFIWVCILIILSPFVDKGSSGVRTGPIFADHAARLATEKFIDQVIVASNSLPKESRVVAGWNLPLIEATLSRRHHDRRDFAVSNGETFEKFDYLLNIAQLREYRRRGVTVYYLPSVRNFNASVFGVDLKKQGAIPLLAGQQ